MVNYGRAGLSIFTDHQPRYALCTALQSRDRSGLSLLAPWAAVGVPGVSDPWVTDWPLTCSAFLPLGSEGWGGPGIGVLAATAVNGCWSLRERTL